MAAIFAGGCSHSTDNVSFKGVWNVQKTNGISGDTTEAVVTVAVSGPRFRISTRDEEGETVECYDGTTLHRLVTPVLLESRDASAAPATPTREAKANIQVESKRFWKRSFSGNGMAGGQVADRDTLLFQSREKMLDGEMTMQAWVDAPTKVVLKKIFTIYSSQIEQAVSKTSEECREIQFGPVGDSDVAPPA